MNDRIGESRSPAGLLPTLLKLKERSNPTVVFWRKFPNPTSITISRNQVRVSQREGQQGTWGHIRASTLRVACAKAETAEPGGQGTFRDSVRLHVSGGSHSTQGPGKRAGVRGRVPTSYVFCKRVWVFFLLKVTGHRPVKGFEQMSNTDHQKAWTSMSPDRSPACRIPAESRTLAHPHHWFGQYVDMYLRCVRSTPGKQSVPRGGSQGFFRVPRGLQPHSSCSLGVKISEPLAHTAVGHLPALLQH